MAGELAMRRVKWLQRICACPGSCVQLRGAVWGTMGGAGATLDEDGVLLDTANPFARQFEEDLWLFKEIEAAAEFFAVWSVKGHSWCSLLTETGTEFSDYLLQMM